MEDSVPLQSNAKPAHSHPHRASYRVAIVGAGCTGLRIATLCELLNRGNRSEGSVECVIFEARASAGGFLQSHRTPEGLVVDHGAQGVLSSRHVFLKTLEDLNLTPQDVISPLAAPQNRTRYLITAKGCLAPLTPLPWSLWKTGLLRPAQWFRAVMEIIRFKSATPPPRNETLYRFVERHFGKAVAENFILPFATGIWGGGSEKLLARHAFPRLPEWESKHGSILRGALLSALVKMWKRPHETVALKHKWPRGLLSFRGGMHDLIGHMLRFLQSAGLRTQLRVASPITSIKALPQGRLLLNETEEFDAVFWTSPPWQNPHLRFESADARSDWSLFQQALTHDLIVVHVTGIKDKATGEGFGALAGRASDGLLGVLFVHSIYKEQCQEGYSSYRILLGGDRNPNMQAWSDEQLHSYALAQLRSLRLLSEHSEVQSVSVVRWHRAVGIADENHDARLAALWRLEAHLPGLHFAGIYKKGVGVADALQSAQDAFDSWLSALHPSH